MHRCKYGRKCFKSFKFRSPFDGFDSALSPTNCRTIVIVIHLENTIWWENIRFFRNYNSKYYVTHSFQYECIRHRVHRKTMPFEVVYWLSSFLYFSLFFSFSFSIIIIICTVQIEDLTTNIVYDSVLTLQFLAETVAMRNVRDACNGSWFRTYFFFFFVNFPATCFPPWILLKMCSIFSKRSKHTSSTRPIEMA